MPNHCDLHEPLPSTSGRESLSLHSPGQILPLAVPHDWFSFNETEEIKNAFVVAKQQCETYLATVKSSSSSSLGRSCPPVFRDTNSIPPGGERRCRGRRMLYELTGAILWPFGPTDCPTYRKCWIGLLSCGSSNKVELSTLEKLVHPIIVKEWQKIEKDQQLRQQRQQIEQSTNSRRRMLLEDVIPTKLSQQQHQQQLQQQQLSSLGPRQQPYNFWQKPPQQRAVTSKGKPKGVMDVNKDREQKGKGMVRDKDRGLGNLKVLVKDKDNGAGQDKSQDKNKAQDLNHEMRPVGYVMNYQHNKTNNAMSNHNALAEVMGKWSIRAVNVRVRVIGYEIVVPEMRYMTINTGSGTRSSGAFSATTTSSERGTTSATATSTSSATATSINSIDTRSFTKKKKRLRVTNEDEEDVVPSARRKSLGIEGAVGSGGGIANGGVLTSTTVGEGEVVYIGRYTLTIPSPSSPIPSSPSTSRDSDSNDNDNDKYKDKYQGSYKNFFRIEMRLEELYPAMLYPLTTQQLALGFHTAGNIYLGGNEERCRPYTKCPGDPPPRHDTYIIPSTTRHPTTR